MNFKMLKIDNLVIHVLTLALLKIMLDPWMYAVWMCFCQFIRGVIAVLLAIVLDLILVTLFQCSSITVQVHQKMMKNFVSTACRYRKSNHSLQLTSYIRSYCVLLLHNIHVYFNFECRRLRVFYLDAPGIFHPIVMKFLTLPWNFSVMIQTSRITWTKTLIMKDTKRRKMSMFQCLCVRADIYVIYTHFFSWVHARIANNVSG